MKYCLVVLLNVILAPHAFASITVLSNHVGAQAFDDADGAGTTTQSFFGTAIPASQTLTAIEGNSSSTTNYQAAGSTSNATFSSSLKHAIDNTLGATTTGCCDIVASFQSSLRFTANTDIPYAISGFYSMLGPATETHLNVFLEDQTTSSLVFRDVSSSVLTPNESFTVGVADDGDAGNFTTGALTGGLMTGHDYRFFFNALTRSVDSEFQEAFLAATATGCIQLELGASAPGGQCTVSEPGSSVPEPGTLGLLVLSLAGAGMVLRRRSRGAPWPFPWLRRA